MKVNKSMVFLAAAAVLLALSLPVPALSEMKEMPVNHCREGHGPMMNKGHLDRMGKMLAICMTQADRLGLTDDQMVKMKHLQSGMQKKQARYAADVKIAEIELMDIMEIKNFDLEKAGFAVKKIAEITADHHLEMIKAMKEMRTSLTDEQFKKMGSMMPGKMCDIKPAKKMTRK